MAIEEDLRQRHHDPNADTPHFFLLIAPGGRGVVTILMPDDGSQCLPVFTSPFRAADYKETLLAAEPPVQYHASTAAQFSGMLRDVGTAGIKTLALDRCPRCSIFTATGIRSLTPNDLLVLWAIHKATEIARLELYFEWALMAARTGEFEAARDVALEIAGHVSLEDPWPHTLLGELAVVLRDRVLLKEAQTFLRFFNHETWEQRVSVAVESGQALFDDYE